MREVNSLFGRKNTQGSSNVAKDRLKLVLIHDRMNCSPELLDMMRAEIIQVISKYMDIDTEDFSIEIASNAIQEDRKWDKGTVLTTNVPIKSLRKS
jgi:cell division topological specificity factor